MGSEIDEGLADAEVQGLEEMVSSKANPENTFDGRGNDYGRVRSIFRPPYYTPTDRARVFHTGLEPYTLAYGTPQTGKSLASMSRFLRFVVLQAPPSRYLCGAQTHDVLFKTDWFLFKELINPMLVRQKRGQDYRNTDRVPIQTQVMTKSGEYSTIYWAPLFDEQNLRGPKLRGFKITEANAIDEDVFKRLLDRMMTIDPYDSIICLDTNLDSQEHWLYKRCVDPATKNTFFRSVLFTPNDNPYISEERKAEIIRENPPGTVWHRRNVLGEWCSAEGSAWPNFKDEWVRPAGGRIFQPVHYIGIDYGFRDPMAVVFHSLTSENTLRVREEYIQSGKVASDVVKEIDRMCKHLDAQLSDCNIIVDRSAAGFIEELKKASGKLPDGSWRMNPKPSDSDNKMDRVRLVYSLASSGAVLYDPRCKRTISNCRNVKWKMVGKREDIVGDDHAFDAHLYATVAANKKHKLFTRTEVKYIQRPDDDEEDGPHAAVKRELERIRP